MNRLFTLFVYKISFSLIKRENKELKLTHLSLYLNNYQKIKNNFFVVLKLLEIITKEE